MKTAALFIALIFCAPAFSQQNQKSFFDSKKPVLFQHLSNEIPKQVRNDESIKQNDKNINQNHEAIERNNEGIEHKNFFGSKNGEILKTIVSFDFESLLSGIKNGGWGFGIRYEKYVAHHAAFAARFGHSTFKLDGWGWCPTVSLSFSAEIYPFSEGLHGFYAAFGSSFDFLGVEDESVGREFVSIYPLAGIKMRLCRFLSADIHGGYKKIVDGDGGAFSESASLVGSGVKVGASLKIHLSELF